MHAIATLFDINLHTFIDTHYEPKESFFCTCAASDFV